MKKHLIIPLMIFILAGCSDDGLKEIESAEKNAKDNRMEEAVALYEKVIKENPEGENTAKAYYELATIYKNGLHPKLSPQIQSQKALEYYKSAYENFPDSKEAPQSMFMTGFILNNDLMNYQAATKTYKEFLTKYPNHELVTAAKAELENIGLTPEQILMKRLQLGKK